MPERAYDRVVCYHVIRDNGGLRFPAFMTLLFSGRRVSAAFGRLS